jgi:hypothetical protein
VSKVPERRPPGESPPARGHLRQAPSILPRPTAASATAGAGAASRGGGGEGGRRRGRRRGRRFGVEPFPRDHRDARRGGRRAIVVSRIFGRVAAAAAAVDRPLGGRRRKIPATGGWRPVAVSALHAHQRGRRCQLQRLRRGTSHRSRRRRRRRRGAAPRLAASAGPGGRRG